MLCSKTFILIQKNAEMGFYELVNTMEYLDCVVKESLRLFPLERSLINRECYRSCTINGVFFPANAEVVLSTMLQDKDPSAWPDVLKFDPERYLKNNF